MAGIALSPLDEVRRSLEEAAESGDVDGVARVRAIRSDLEDLLGVADGLLVEAAMPVAPPSATVAEARFNADLRDELLRRGMATEEVLDGLGFPSHRHLDEAAEAGRLQEAAFGALAKLGNSGGAGLLGKWMERLHPRDQHGKFSDKPGGAALRQMVGADAKGSVRAPSGRKPERVFPTQPVRPHEVAVQAREGLPPGGRPVGMSRAQAKAERARTPEGARKLRGQVQAPEEIAKARQADREKRKAALGARVAREIKTGQKKGKPEPHLGEHGKVSQNALLDYADQALSTPSTADAHSEVRNGQRIYHSDRQQLHNAIIDVLLRSRNEDGSLSATNPYLPSQEQPNVLFLGGGYAAGKSSARKILQGRGEVPTDALTIDPDQIKAMLPEFIATAGHDPEANLRVYREAWDVSQQLQREAQQRKLNVIVDGITNTSADEVIGRVRGFKDKGYADAKIAYVDVPTDVALTRAAERAQKAADRGDVANMRHIPEEIMRSVHRDVAATIPAVMNHPERQGLGLSIDVIDGQHDALPIASIGPNDTAPTVHHDPAWARLTAKGNEGVAGVDKGAKAHSTDPHQHEKLPENHGSYFNMSNDTKTVPLDALKPTKQPEADPGHVARAHEKMKAAAKGDNTKRDPISVHDNGDGTYSVKDGNGTYGAAVRSDWSSLPVKVVSGTPAKPADPEIAKAQQEVAKAINNGLTPHEKQLTPAVPEMSFKTEKELYGRAREVQTEFLSMLDQGAGVNHALGGQAHVMQEHTDEDLIAAEFEKAMAAVAAAPDQAHVIVAPLKGVDRAREKVDTKYNGNWGKLSDAVRGTVVVPHPADVQTALASVRAEAEKRGWTVSALENRMVKGEGQGSPGPTASGYSDFTIRLANPDGFQTELQFNTPSMMEVKQGEGHKLYEQEREVYADAARRGLPLSAAERQNVQQLRQRQTELYTAAWEKSLRASRLATK